MGFAEQNTAKNTEATAKAAAQTNQKLDAVVAELKELNQNIRALLAQRAPA